MTTPAPRRAGSVDIAAYRSAIRDAMAPLRASGGGRRRGGDMDACIHAARKALKKARALLRLLRGCMDETTYQKENEALRDAGRALSPARNPTSLLDALALLRRRCADHLDEVDLAAPEKALRRDRLQARRRFAAPGGALEHCMALLKGCHARAASIPTRRATPALLDAELRAIYRKGRKAEARAHDDREVETLHEWRKQVKYLANAIAALQEETGSALDKTLERMHRLGDWLGEEHDLGLLAQANRGANSSPTLDACIERRRHRLQRRAFTLGRKIYAEPSRFAASLPATARARSAAVG